VTGFFHSSVWSPPVLILHHTEANQDWKAAEVVVEYSGTAAK
jgi:hypothetical protein